MWMGGSFRMLSLYNLALRPPKMQTHPSSAPPLGDRTAESATESEEAAAPQVKKPAWVPFVYAKNTKEIHHFVGREIKIEEYFDNFGGSVWPGALSLCKYLDSHRGQINLMDKAVLEIGSGTGLVSIVASLLGAFATATDLPEVLSNLRFNLSRNTRGRSRYAPQAAALSWGYDLEETYPKSVYRYDYVMATDVVYAHNFLDELLATMKHFCQSRTTLIWANRVRFESDLTFTEKFKKAFHTTLLVEEEKEMKIYMATLREGMGEWIMEGKIFGLLYFYAEEGSVTELDVQEDDLPAWASCRYSKHGIDFYFYVGQEIGICECLDSYGALIWPGALALCHYLDTNRLPVNLVDKEVLELGSGTGLVSIVASLLGASVTATDLPEVLPNLSSNVTRSTKQVTHRHTPRVKALSWGYDLEETYPKSVYRYDYVLAADVVYAHDFVVELLGTMKHFCQRGTTLIWANKVRFDTDLTFTENFKKAFETTLLAELGVVKIYMATLHGN
ncbi:uncharacterized protein mettl21ca [Aplochiton taeniatus]